MVLDAGFPKLGRTDLTLPLGGRLKRISRLNLTFP